MRFRLFLAGYAACCLLPDAHAAEPLTLWYRQPARKWEEALPLGNGRLGAMVFGDVTREHLQLNEQTVWAGPPCPEPKQAGAERLREARQLFFDEKFSEGEQFVKRHFLPPTIEPRSYQTLGDLDITMGHGPGGSNYVRSLNLDTAIATTSYTHDGVRYVREVLVSRADDVILVRLAASEPGRIQCQIGLARPDARVETRESQALVMTGQAAHGTNNPGVKFAAWLSAETEGGTVRAEGGQLAVEHASTLTLRLSAATDYNRREPARPLDHDLVRAARKSVTEAGGRYEQLKRRSVESHQKLFRRVALDLGATPEAPTDERLKALRSGTADPALQALYFQFGRYLLMGSSRPGGLPANLQGLWNQHMRAPWNADYHININIQMNYWPAEVANLSECHEPFFDFVEALRPAGRRAAKEAFGCGGFCANLTSDPWYWTTPYGEPRWGMWVMGGGWCTQHFMERYRFTGDREFLRERAFPILAEASEFFLDWLTTDPKTGNLVSGPSTSPENGFVAPDGKTVTLSMGCSMDQEIIWDTFSNTLEAAAVLGISNPLTARIEKALAHLAVPQIGADGRLMEWAREYKEPEPGHRHVSHLFGMHPGRQFTLENSPEMVAAARKSIDHRLANGGGHTGWSRAWIINFWARFREAEKAHENVVALLQKSTFDNLFDNHPPFQIDGNFGGAAGIAEMLLQSHEVTRGSDPKPIIHLLPGLPSAWPAGSIKGLRARGGFEISAEWRDGKLLSASVTSRLGKAAELRCQGQRVPLALGKGETALFGPGLAAR